jgi:cyclopropane-fatty-acyl-phospholipid synthase
VLGTRVANAVRGRGQNVRRHYDIGDDLFESFLDSTLTYSCGYATSPENDLEQLQRDKLDRICRKLRLAPGDRLVDIGCGYGGLVTFAAEHYGVSAVGITISHRHHEKASAVVAERGLGDRATIRFGDYRALDGEFDKLVSVGMMEHVPLREYPEYFRAINRLLGPRGMGLVHTIGRTRTMHDHDPFIQRYIFPNSDTPRLSEIAANLERQRLAVLDVENLQRHYGYTVLGWLERFRENRARLAGRYDTRVQRMFEYYFACGIAAARAAHSALWQVLFTKDHTADRPLQRV